MVLTLTAFGTLSPASDSYSTRAPSASEREAPASILLWSTKRSFLPSSCVMKPKPFSSLNHLTVPCAMYFLHCFLRAASAVVAQKATVCERLHCFRRTSARPKLRAPYHG